jgi:prevent-host-death family protein
MKQVNMHQAKTTLSKLVDAAAAGEEIIIAKAGKPVAKLVPLNPAQTTSPRPSRIGFMKGKLNIPDDFFDAPLPEDVMRYFRGEGED